MSTIAMSFISKLINFIKNAHPIKNFAKPVHGRLRTISEVTTPSYSQVSISYESIREEIEKPLVVETPAVTYQELVPSYTVQETYPQFQATLEQTVEEVVEAEPVMVMKKLSITPDATVDIENTPVVEAPLDPDTVISSIVDLSLYQDEDMPEIKLEMNTPELVIGEEIEEVVAVEAEPVVEAKPTRRKRTTTTKKETKTPKAKATKTPAKKATKTAKKTTTKKTTATKTTRTRKKKEGTPQEAMGFGF